MPDHADSSSPFVVTTTRETFDRDVFERSHEVPVVVDFWAPWCGPCQMLGPLLEKLADEYAGRFVLVKVNTDEQTEAATAFRVQSIPAVFAVVGGNIASSFTGLVPEPQLRDWLDQLLVEQSLAEATAAEDQQPEEAERLYRVVLEQVPKQATAMIGLARTLLSQQRVDEAAELVAQLESRGFLEPEAEKVKAALAMQAKQGLDVNEARRAMEQDPDNFEKQLTLAEALSGAGKYQQALDLCLELVERDREATGESARQMMLEIFHVLPADSPLTRDYRRKLSMLLF